MNTKRGFAAIIPIIIIGFLLVAGGYYFWAQKEQSPLSNIVYSPTPTPAYMEGWRTYSIEIYNFEVQYPPDWEISDNLKDESHSLSIIKAGPTNSKFDWVDGSMLIVSLVDSTTIDLAQELALSSEDVKTLDAQKFNFQGWEGYRLARNLNDPPNYNEFIIVTKTSPSGKVFKINWSQIDSRNGLTAEKYLLPILSTFKFTN